MKWLFVFLLSINVTWAKEYFTINGFVTDQASGEPLALANVVSIKTKIGTNTNTFGYYSLIVEADSIDLEFSYVGYQKKGIKLFVDRNIRLDIGLAVHALDEVIIFANDDKSARSILGTNKLNSQLISRTATLLTESDVIKSLQLFPGVQGGNEGFATLSVRGGSHDQNLLLLDGIPTYNASHLFGFLSTFNPDIVKDVVFIKGDIPARYGERLSSVVDISTKDGNAKKLKGSFSLSPITNQLSLEGPVIKQKSSFIVSTRRTWLDAIINLASPDNPIKYNFGDFNVKYNHNINAKNKLYAGLNTSSDKFFSDMNVDNSSYHFRWGSSAYYLRWNKIFSTKLFGSFSIYASDFKFSQSYNSKEQGRVERRTFKSAIFDNSLNLNFDYSAGSRHYLRFGAQVSYLTFKPDIVEAIGFDVNENSFPPGRQYNGAKYPSGELHI